MKAIGITHWGRALSMRKSGHGHISSTVINSTLLHCKRSIDIDILLAKQGAELCHA